jgi:hypothetical protein
MATDEWLARMEKTIEEMAEVQSRQVIAIRDLVVLTATILDAQKQVRGQMYELQDTQKQTDERINALIDTVDRVIRGETK